MADSAKIKFPPPVLFLGFFLLAGFLRHFFPILKFAIGIRFSFGPFFGVAGLALIAFAIREFRMHKTSVVPNREASKLLTSGVFRISRNPIYLGLTLLYLGSIFYLGTLWGILLLPILLMMVNSLIIRREEVYLGRRFGEEYTAYRQRVRKWL